MFVIYRHRHWDECAYKAHEWKRSFSTHARQQLDTERRTFRKHFVRVLVLFSRILMLCICEIHTPKQRRLIRHLNKWLNDWCFRNNVLLYCIAVSVPTSLLLSFSIDLVCFWPKLLSSSSTFFYSIDACLYVVNSIANSFITLCWCTPIFECRKMSHTLLLPSVDPYL